MNVPFSLRVFVADGDPDGLRIVDKSNWIGTALVFPRALLLQVKSVVGLVVPTGYSFNLDGTNIYMTLAALFIAQATDTHLTLGHQIALLLVAMLSSKGAAGVTGAGFITLAATLAVVPEVPVAGMALILGVDRFMSECRSLTNFIGNAVATVVVSRWENALDADRLRRVLDGEAEFLPEPERAVEPVVLARHRA